MTSADNFNICRIWSQNNCKSGFITSMLWHSQVMTSLLVSSCHDFIVPDSAYHKRIWLRSEAQICVGWDSLEKILNLWILKMNPGHCVHAFTGPVDEWTLTQVQLGNLPTLHSPQPCLIPKAAWNLVLSVSELFANDGFQKDGKFSGIGAELK